MFSNENVQVVSRVSVLNFSLKNKCVFEESCPWNVLRYQVSSIFSWLNKDINSLNCSCRYFAASYQPARSWVFLLLSRGYHVTSRGVTRLDGARGEKQVRRPHVRTWGLSEANVLYWRKCLWNCFKLNTKKTIKWDVIIDVFGCISLAFFPLHKCYEGDT